MFHPPTNTLGYWNMCITWIELSAGNILVGVAFDEHPLCGFLRFTLSSVLSKLSERVGLGTEKKRVLCCFHVLWPPFPCLQAGVLKGSGIGEGNVPWIWRLVHRIQVQGCFNLRLSTGQKLHNSRQHNFLF